MPCSRAAQVVRRYVLVALLGSIALCTAPITIPCRAHTTAATAFATSSGASYAIVGCGCLDIVYVTLPTVATNIVIAATGSYLSVVRGDQLAVTLSSVTITIRDSSCAYSSRSYVNGSMAWLDPAQASNYRGMSVLPPFVALYSPSPLLSALVTNGVNVTIDVINVTIMEPSLGNETDSIMRSRIFITPWVGIVASGTLTNVSVAWRNVTLSHGGVRNMSRAGDNNRGATLVLISSLSTLYGHNCTIRNVSVTQRVEKIVSLLPGVNGTHQEIAAFRLVASAISSVGLSFSSSGVNLTCQPTSHTPNDISVHLLALSGNTTTKGVLCPMVNSSVTWYDMDVRLLSVTAVVGIIASNFNMTSTAVYLSRVVIVCDVRGALQQDVKGRFSSVLYVDDDSFLWGSAVVIVDTTVKSFVVSGSEFGLAGSVQASWAAVAMIKLTQLLTIDLTNVGLVARLSNGTTNSVHGLDKDNSLGSVVGIGLFVSLFFSTNMTQNVTIVAFNCSVEGSFVLEFNESLVALAGAAATTLALINLAALTTDVKVMITNSTVSLISSAAKTRTYFQDPLMPLPPSQTKIWNVSNTTALISLAPFLDTNAIVDLIVAKFTALNLPPEYVTRANQYRNLAAVVKNVVVRAVGSTVSVTAGGIGVNDGHNQVALASLPAETFASDISFRNCTLHGGSVFQFTAASSLVVNTSLFVCDSSLTLTGSVLGYSAHFLYSNLTLSRCIVRQGAAAPTSDAVVVAGDSAQQLLGMQESIISFADCMVVGFTKLFKRSNYNETYSRSSRLVLGCNAWQASNASSSLRGLYVKDIANPPALELSYSRGTALIPAEDSNGSGVLITCPGAHRPSTLTPTVVVEAPVELSFFENAAALTQGIASAVVGGLAMSAAASMQGLALLGGSMCAPPQFRSSSKYTQYLISPFSDLGGVGVVCGNAGVTLAVFALQRALIAWRMHRRKESLEQASAKVRYPGWTYLVAVFVEQGVLRGSITLLKLKDGLEDASGVRRAGSVAVGVCGVLYSLFCIAVVARIHLAVVHDRMIFVAYPRHVYGSARLLTLKQFVLPIGYWGDESLKSRYGKVVSSVKYQGRHFSAYAVLTTMLVNIVVSLPLEGATGCVALWTLCMAVTTAAALMLLIRRPSRTPVVDFLDASSYLLSTVVALCAALTSGGLLDDEGRSASTAGIFISVVAIGRAAHGLYVARWEKKLSALRKKGRAMESCPVPLGLPQRCVKPRRSAFANVSSDPSSLDDVDCEVELNELDKYVVRFIAPLLHDEHLAGRNELSSTGRHSALGTEHRQLTEVESVVKRWHRFRNLHWDAADYISNRNGGEVRRIEVVDMLNNSRRPSTLSSLPLLYGSPPWCVLDQSARLELLVTLCCSASLEVVGGDGQSLI